MLVTTLNTMSFELTTLEGWKASYRDPIRLQCGDILRLTGKIDFWDGHKWVWAVAPDGREGWIPDSLSELEDGTTLATSDYSAEELTCSPGELLIGKYETHGWTWCVNDQGDAGWLPSRIVKRE